MSESENKKHELRHLNFRGAKPSRFPSKRRSAPAGLSRGNTSSHPRKTDDHSPEGLAAWLLEQAGLNPSHYRAAPLHRRLPACLRVLRAPSAEAAWALLRRDPAQIPVALDALLLGVTQFFRDRQVFEDLRQFLPDIARKHRNLRIWSVACSSGCELYSIVILLAELGLLHSAAEFLGTDCREQALWQAQRGCYMPDVLENLQPELRVRYFEPEESDDGLLRIRLAAQVRSQIHWRRQDILNPDAEKAHATPHWDVILWRNAAIYLKTGASRSVWHRLTGSLRPGGLLITGKAERPDSDLPLKRLSPCIYVNTAEKTRL